MNEKERLTPGFCISTGSAKTTGSRVLAEILVLVGSSAGSCGALLSSREWVGYKEKTRKRKEKGNEVTHAQRLEHARTHPLT